VGVDSVVGDVGGVYHMGDGKAARFRGFWGEQGGWDAFQACSGGSGGVFCRSERPRSRSEGGGTRGTGVIEYDVAAALGGSRCLTGVRGMGWGVLGAVDDLLELRCGSWGRQSCSIECTTCSDEHVRTSWRNGVCWAVDRLCSSFRPW
jgi:hypothetical protein